MLKLTVLALACSSAVARPFFKLTNTNKAICFAEEIQDSAEFAEIRYNWLNKHNDVTVNVNVISPKRRTNVLSKNLQNDWHVGTLNFEPVKDEYGEYDICFAVLSELSDSQQVEISVAIDFEDRSVTTQHHVDADGFSRLHPKEGNNQQADIVVFENEYGQIEETLRDHEEVEAMGTEMERINREARELLLDVTKFYHKQVRMRQTAESTFERVWGFSAITLGTIVIVGYVQYVYLKSYLKKKKVG